MSDLFEEAKRIALTHAELVSKPSACHQMIHMQPHHRFLYKAWALHLDISFSELVLVALKEYTDDLEV
jgi:hypothetical protein